MALRDRHPGWEESLGLEQLSRVREAPNRPNGTAVDCRRRVCLRPSVVQLAGLRQFSFSRSLEVRAANSAHADLRFRISRKFSIQINEREFS